MTNDLKPLEDRRKGYTPPEEALRILESMGIKEEPPVDDKPAGLEGKVNIVLDESAADKGEKRTQDNWFDYWNNIKDGRAMASMGDLYLGFKEVKRIHEKGTEQEKTKAQTWLAGLQEDFDWSGKSDWLISSTRIIYSPNNYDATIVQHYRCSQPGLSKEIDLTIPVYQGVLIEHVMDDSKGLKYLQTLFDTEDDAETIIQTLEFVSGKNRGDIDIWTRPFNHISAFHSERPDGAAGFGYGKCGFYVDGENDPSDIGRSRGVSVNQR